MILKVDWENPILREDIVLEIQPSDLDAFYIYASEEDQTNIFFVLLTSFYHYLDQKQNMIAAHLCFLMAYYLFTPMTPPGSETLARHYIHRAVALNPLDIYKTWIPMIESGN